jgi:uncharacterized protein
MNRRTTLPVLAIVPLLVLTAAAQTIQINRENKTIAISTTDEATTTADLAAINIGFDLYDSDSEPAYLSAGKLSHAILDALHKAGIDDKSIESKTQALSRNTNFDDKDTKDQRTKKQFHFEQSWEVTTSPQNASAVIRLAITAGANQSGQIEWRLADRKSLQAQAAANALVKARAVASQMAEGLHVKLGALIYASNETPNAKIYFARPLAALVMNTESASVSSVIQAGLPLEIRPQTIREEATVYAVFAIE